MDGWMNGWMDEWVDKCRMSESVELLTQIDAGRGQQPQEDATIETPNMHEFK